MKHTFEKAQESLRSIIEIISLIVVFIIPPVFNVAGFIELCFQSTDINFENIKYYFLLRLGNWVIGLVFMFLLLTRIRSFNKEKIFNTKNVYHDYWYAWYWFCSKILGYKTCNLKLVPIFTQFKLTLNDTFPDYYVGTDEDYSFIENEQIDIDKINYSRVSHEINLILADTYPVSIKQLPTEKRRLSTIVINRKRPNVNRYYSPQFVASIVDEVRKLPSKVTDINVYATTNPKHTLKISRDAFKLAERGNIKKLIVFQQEKDGIRKFGRQGKIIYNRK